MITDEGLAQMAEGVIAVHGDRIDEPHMPAMIRDSFIWYGCEYSRALALTDALIARIRAARTLH